MVWREAEEERRVEVVEKLLGVRVEQEGALA